MCIFHFNHDYRKGNLRRSHVGGNFAFFFERGKKTDTTFAEHGRLSVVAMDLSYGNMVTCWRVVTSTLWRWDDVNMLLCGMGPWRDFLEVPKSPTNVMKLLQSKSTWRSLPSPVSLSNTARFDLGGSGVNCECESFFYVSQFWGKTRSSCGYLGRKKEKDTAGLVYLYNLLNWHSCGKYSFPMIGNTFPNGGFFHCSFSLPEGNKNYPSPEARCRHRHV